MKNKNREEVLKIENYKPFLEFDEHSKNEIEWLEIPTNDLYDLIESDRGVKEELQDLMRDDILPTLDDYEVKELAEEKGLKIQQPVYWSLNAADFKRAMCDILEIGYHSGSAEILARIEERLRGL